MRLAIALLGALTMAPTTSEAGLFDGWRSSYYAPYSTSYYAPYSTSYGPSYAYGFGYASYAPSACGACRPTFSSCCSPCSSCSPCNACSSCGSSYFGACGTCSSCPGGDCSVAAAGPLTPTPDSGTPRTFKGDGYDDEGTDSPPKETDGFEGREPFDTEGDFDAPLEGEERDAFKPPIKPGDGTVVPQKKSPASPTLEDATARIQPLQDDGGFAWTVAPVRSRVRVRSNFGNPVVARTTIDPNADWETVPVTKVAEK